MKILEIIEGLDPGGAQRFVVDLSNELANTHEVTLGTFIDRAGCEFYADDLSHNVRRYNSKYKPSKLLKFRQTLSVFRMISKFKPDVVHVHDKAFIPCILPSLFYHKTKFFYTVHNVAEKDAGAGIGARLRKIFLKKSILPIAISKYCALTFEKFYGYKPFSIIENGCRPLHMTSSYCNVVDEISSLKKNDKTKVFLNIARFFEQKNHELLIDSFNSLIEEGNNVLLLIIGSSPDAQRKLYLESMVKDKSRIKFIGAKHNVQDYLMSSDYFCLSSSWEGLPITILEAGLCGCYSISTPVGGVPDVLQDDSVGLLSRDLSIASYKDAILRAFRMNPDRNSIRKYFLSKYTMTECAKKYIQVFERD